MAMYEAKLLADLHSTEGSKASKGGCQLVLQGKIKANIAISSISSRTLTNTRTQLILLGFTLIGENMDTEKKNPSFSTATVLRN